jgi:hypothetical protein
MCILPSFPDIIHNKVSVCFPFHFSNKPVCSMGANGLLCAL